MAKSKKRISVNAFENQVRAMRGENTSTFMWGDIEVTVKRLLPFEEYIEFVHDVAATCFTLDDYTYLPETKNFAINANILTHYANFTLPKDNNLSYELIHDSNIVSEVLKYVDKTQLNEILSAVDEKIDAELQLCTSMIQLELGKLVDTMSDLGDKFGAMFSGIEQGDLKGVIDAIVEGKFDENKLVSAFFDQKKRAQNIEVTQNENKSRGDSEES